MSRGTAMAEPLLNMSGKSIILLVIVLNIPAIIVGHTAAPNVVEGGDAG
jgi:hypothetical protein